MQTRHTFLHLACFQDRKALGTTAYVLLLQVYRQDTKMTDWPKRCNNSWSKHNATWKGLLLSMTSCLSVLATKHTLCGSSNAVHLHQLRGSWQQTGGSRALWGWSRGPPSL